jgi:hypothetical protein
MIRSAALGLTFLALLLVACSGDRRAPPATGTASTTREAEPTSTASATPTPTPTVIAPLMTIRATRLRIPSLGIDAEVQPSEVVPSTGSMPAGCPARPAGGTTLTVPQEGIATPMEAFAGLEGTAWIYGHSRWLGNPGLFYALSSINTGDEVFVDGVEYEGGATVEDRRFVVQGIYLADTDSGGALVTPADPEARPTSARVVLQTSVRERGEGRPWILDRATVESKAETIVEGDVNDPCKYLLLFVVATAS